MNIRLAKKSAPYGVKVPEFKELSAASPVEPAPLPEVVVLPLHQCLGAPSRAAVKRADKVLTGQKIAESDRPVSALVHATLSGEVTAAGTIINPVTGGVMDTLTITSDGQDKWAPLDVPKDPENLPPEEIVKRIREAGIVGLGGATFPTHIKLSPPKDKKIDTIILDGCESEPYITSDHRVMLEYGEKVLAGLSLTKKVLGATTVIIAVEDNKEDAIVNLEKIIREKGYPFQIAPLKGKYSVGAEKVLVKILLKREVPLGGLPLDVGVVVKNVSTSKAIYDAIYEGKPLIQRVVTVSGAVKNPKNLLVRFGTPIKSLIDLCGGVTDEGGEVIIGGPMMGIATHDINFPVTKGVNGIVVKEAIRVNEQNCINCGRCVEVCPMGLVPALYARHVKKGRWDDAREAYVENSIECGSCAYVCPANIPLVQYIKIAKREIARRRAAKK